MQKEVSEIRSYFSILKTIAAGNHKLGKIAANLEVPVTEENSSKSKQGRYFIKDNFIRFWFRFVYPYKSLVESDQEGFVMEKIRQNFIDGHVAYVYEYICRK